MRKKRISPKKSTRRNLIAEHDTSDTGILFRSSIGCFFVKSRFSFPLRGPLPRQKKEGAFFRVVPFPASPISGDKSEIEAERFLFQLSIWRRPCVCSFLGRPCQAQNRGILVLIILYTITDIIPTSSDGLCRNVFV